MARWKLSESGSGELVIIGLGIDISEIDRMREAIERRGQALVKRVFTPAEISYCEQHRDPFERFAARFAAKEAAMKALGTGWRRGVRWVDIEVARMPSGRPELRLHGVAKEIAARMGVGHISLSITHSGNIAFAQVIFES
jgi:holo-[acyl-carrier protein] synthase